MRERWSIVGAILLAIGALAFFTSSEIQVQVGVLPFSFALITFFVGGIVLLIAGIVAFIINRI